MTAPQLLNTIASACQMFAKRARGEELSADLLAQLEASIGSAIEEAWQELERGGRRVAPVERRLARRLAELRAERLRPGR